MRVIPTIIAVGSWIIASAALANGAAVRGTRNKFQPKVFDDLSPKDQMNGLHELASGLNAHKNDVASIMRNKTGLTTLKSDGTIEHYDSDLSKSIEAIFDRYVEEDMAVVYLPKGMSQLGLAPMIAGRVVRPFVGHSLQHEVVLPLGGKNETGHPNGPRVITRDLSSPVEKPLYIKPGDYLYGEQLPGHFAVAAILSAESNRGAPHLEKTKDDIDKLLEAAGSEISLAVLMKSQNKVPVSITRYKSSSFIDVANKQHSLQLTNGEDVLSHETHYEWSKVLSREFAHQLLVPFLFEPEHMHNIANY